MKSWVKEKLYIIQKREVSAETSTRNVKPYRMKMVSASSKKLKRNTCAPQDTHKLGNMIFNLDILFGEIRRCLRCLCGGKVNLSVSCLGLGGTVSVCCEQCEITQYIQNSVTLGAKNRVYTINRQMIYAMRCLGQGLAGTKLFCALMNFPPPVRETTYNIIVNKILTATDTVVGQSMSQAASEEISLTQNNELSVSCDGSWLTRGHTSQFGVAAVIGANSGKILDTEVLSLNCKSCQFWYRKRDTNEYAEWMERHAGTCMINHEGSSGNMEVQGMKKIFLRSEQKHGVRYINFIGDGDAKTFKAVSDVKPYGLNVSITKLECVGHIQKRMGTRLRKIKEEYKGKKLSDGKLLSGKNRLTDAVINTLSKYYGNAIRQNKTVEDMQKAVWAIWFHKASTDAKPTHYACPEGAGSWCSYQRAKEANMLSTYKHKNNIPISIMEVIKLVFQDLCNTKLLKRCVGGFTQNANESFHSKSWKICPKTGFFGKRIIQIGTNDAVITFNDGMAGRLKVLEKLHIPIGTYMTKELKQVDEARIRSAEKRAIEATKEARKCRKRLKLENEAKKIES